MYEPLLICKNFHLDVLQNSKLLYDIYKRALEEENLDAVMSFSFFNAFMDKDYKGNYSWWNDFFIKHKANLFNSYEIIPDITDTDKGLMSEVICPFLMTKKWSVCKQVYCFDEELELALTDVDEVNVPVQVLQHLPYNCFYIEFSPKGIFASNLHGVFVNVMKIKDGYGIVFMRIGTNSMIDTGSVSFIPNSSSGEPSFIVDRFEDVYATAAHPDWAEFAMFTLNAILYLCAENSEVFESPVTKATYKPGTVVKNKFSEVQKWDCGIRYGNTVRLNKTNTNLHGEENEAEEESDQITRKHTASVPHTRKAHWHHYWTGKGRTTLILKWLPPITVGYGETDVVIHKVK